MVLFGLSNNPAFNSKLGYSITTKKGSWDPICWTTTIHVYWMKNVMRLKQNQWKPHQSLFVIILSTAFHNFFTFSTALQKCQYTYMIIHRLIPSQSISSIGTFCTLYHLEYVFQIEHTVEIHGHCLQPILKLLSYSQRWNKCLSMSICNHIFNVQLMKYMSLFRSFSMKAIRRIRIQKWPPIISHN